MGLLEGGKEGGEGKGREREREGTGKKGREGREGEGPGPQIYFGLEPPSSMIALLFLFVFLRRRAILNFLRKRPLSTPNERTMGAYAYRIANAANYLLNKRRRPTTHGM